MSSLAADQFIYFLLPLEYFLQERRKKNSIMTRVLCIIGYVSEIFLSHCWYLYIKLHSVRFFTKPEVSLLYRFHIILELKRKSKQTLRFLKSSYKIHRILKCLMGLQFIKECFI
jgi:hypothetical protein